MREAVFSSLGTRIEAVRFLDLFAGSGSYGLEAVSRGASGGLFVEKHQAAVDALQRNIEAVRKSIGAREIELKVIKRDVLRFTSKDRFPLIFMDPPYDLIREKAPGLLQLARGLIDDTGKSPVLVFELPGDIEATGEGWHCFRRIGKSGTNEPSIALLEPVPST